MKHKQIKAFKKLTRVEQKTLFEYPLEFSSMENVSDSDFNLIWMQSRVWDRVFTKEEKREMVLEALDSYRLTDMEKWIVIYNQNPFLLLSRWCRTSLTLAYKARLKKKYGPFFKWNVFKSQ